MQDDQNTTAEPSVPTNTAAPKTDFIQAPAVSAKSSILKDFSIPLSIVIAGMFVGAGLYFGGNQAPAIAPLVAEEEVVDNTGKVDAVTEADHMKGSLDAPIMVVEFSDFDCPFCSRFHEVMNTVVAKYDDVAWVYRHFPLEQLHPNAPYVAVVSECVAELAGEDGFWNFSDAYFEARGAGDQTAHEVLVPKLALEAGVPQAALAECLESGRHNNDVQTDVSDAVETGGRGTPWSIIIGPSGKTYPVNGALPQAAVEQLIEAARADA
jgi:protein-disulfide isomerase